MTKKKKIAFILPNLMNGGAERIASNWIMNFSDDVFEKYIILYDGSRIDYPYIGKLFDLNSKNTQNPLMKPFLLIKRFLKIRKIKNKYCFDYCISLVNGPNFINIITKQKEKVIISIHSFKSKRMSGFYGKIYKYLIKLFFNKADAIIAVSKAVEKDLIMNFGLDQSKIQVIYNFIEIEKVKELTNETIEDKYLDIFNRMVIITVGRPVKAKGHWHLLRAFKKVLSNISDLNLVIIGEGRLSDYLIKLTHDLGIEKNVYFLGYQKNPFKFMARSEFFVLSSIYEGFPLAPIEAMICGLPIISTNCKSGPEEILSPNTEFDADKPFHAKYGILTPVCDGVFRNADYPLTNEENLLSDEIMKLTNNKDMQNSYIAIGKERLNNFSPDAILNKWYKLFNSLDIL